MRDVPAAERHKRHSTLHLCRPHPLRPERRVVHDRREEVNGLDQSEVVGEPVDGGVIRPGDPHEEIRVLGGFRTGQTAQNLRQLVWAELARSAGAVRERCEPFHATSSRQIVDCASLRRHRCRSCRLPWVMADTEWPTAV